MTVRDRRDPRIPAGAAIERRPPPAPSPPRNADVELEHQLGSLASDASQPTRFEAREQSTVLPCHYVMTDTAARSFGADVDAHGSAVGESRPVPFATRPVLQGTLGMVAAGHYLAAAIGLRMLEAAATPIDAGVAAGFALSLLKPQSVGIGGEAPILIHLAEQGRSVAINGQGWAPRAATIDWFRSRGIRLIPSDGFLPATVPAQFAAWCTALQHFGTASLADVLGPSVEMAEGGFPMYAALRNAVARVAERFQTEWPTSAAIYLDRWPSRPTRATLLRNPDWARTLKGAIDASLREAGSGREASIQAAIDYFYTGPVAEQAVEFSSSNAFLDDSGEAHTGLAVRSRTSPTYGARGTQIEEPVRVDVPRRRGPQVRPVEPGAGLAAAVEAARGLRPARARPQHGRVPARLPRVRQARLRRSRALLRRSRVRRPCRSTCCCRRSTPPSGAS